MENKNNEEYRWISMGLFAKFLVAALFMTLPMVQAQTAPLDTTISAEDQAQYDQILTPVMKIYNFLKYAASIVGVIAMLGAGIVFMFSGNDIRRRDIAKHTMSYAIIGLSIVWAAPFAVDMLIS